MNQKKKKATKFDLSKVFDMMLPIIRNFSTNGIVLFPRPDPDAIACGDAIKTIFKHLRDDAWSPEIYYTGGIGHQQNREMITVLGLKDSVRPLPDDLEASEIIMVDSSTFNDHDLPERFQDAALYKLVFDHHETDCETTTEVGEDGVCYLIDKSVRACTTLLVEMASHFNVPVEEFQVAAMIGIYTDTSAYTNATARDRAAYDVVATDADKSQAERILSYTLPREHLAHLALADQNQETQDGLLLTNIGMVDTMHTDDVATAASTMIRFPNVDLVVVWCLYEAEGGTTNLRMAARSTRTGGFDLGDYLRNTFSCGGAKPDGQLSQAGGATITFDVSKIHRKRAVKDLVAYVHSCMRDMVFPPQE